MQSIGYILWTQAHIVKPLEKLQPPFSSSLSQTLLYFIVIRFRFFTRYQSSKALTSNSILPLPHFKKKKSIQKAPHHKSHFSEKLIAQISRPSRDWVDKENQSPFRPSTRRHALSKVSVLFYTPPAPPSRFYLFRPSIQLVTTSIQYIGGQSVHEHKNKADLIMNAPLKVPAFRFTRFQSHTRAPHRNQSCLTHGSTRGSLDPIRDLVYYFFFLFNKFKKKKKVENWF